MRIASSPCGLRVGRALFFATTCLALLASAEKARAFNTPFNTTRFRLTVYEKVAYANSNQATQEYENIIQFSEFRIYTKDSFGNYELVNIDNCAQNELKKIDTVFELESAAQTCDNDLNTKIVAPSFTVNSRLEIDFNVSNPGTIVYQYEICTGNDDSTYTSRRPKAWYLTAKIDDSRTSADLGDWFLLDHQTDGGLMTLGDEACKKFTTVNYTREVYRLRTTASGPPIKIDEFVPFENGNVTDFDVYCGNDEQDAGEANPEGAHNLKESSKPWRSKNVENDLMFFFYRNTVLDEYTMVGADVEGWKIYHLEDDLTWYEIHNVTGNSDTSESRTFIVDPGPRCACMKEMGFFM